MSGCCEEVYTYFLLCSFMYYLLSCYRSSYLCFRKHVQCVSSDVVCVCWSLTVQVHDVPVVLTQSMGCVMVTVSCILVKFQRSMFVICDEFMDSHIHTHIHTVLLNPPTMLFSVILTSRKILHQRYVKDKSKVVPQTHLTSPFSTKTPLEVLFQFTY